ncbi:hypothetical protein [Litoribrevibacter albus]|uniref:Transposase n=1 Tax=Litoribrevibacter albus TaxID=1473156 RepID=A0AA37SDG1_9GAMM|nr:hypothetical protein [Litoribrevibacter albus]GLQ32855.1 hypothetical protein GCM10007876_33340 [Litoribrevibacter albus]
MKSQALLDEKALLACMAYVDLNAVRAKMARVPEHSDHTSVKKHYLKAVKTEDSNSPKEQVRSLLPFTGYPNNEPKKGLPVLLTDYLALVDWTECFLRLAVLSFFDFQSSSRKAVFVTGAEGLILVLQRYRLFHKIGLLVRDPMKTSA